VVVARTLSPAVAASLAAALAALGVTGKAPAAMAATSYSQCLPAATARHHGIPWAQRLLAPDRVWNVTTGAGQVVAVLDTGVSATAPALSGAVLPGLNVLNGKSGDTDCLGHGTFVAGLIAAHASAGTGFAGLAPGARILPVIVVGSGPDARVSSAALANGIRYAVNSGATIIDISATTSGRADPGLLAAVGYALSRNVLVIAPVGTGQASQSNVPSYPAAYPGVIAVAAVTAAGQPVSAGAAGVRVDLAAPGSDVVSIGPRGAGQFTSSGAAAATGFVAGTAALVRAYYPRLSARQVTSRLELTADAPGTTLPDPGVGYGIVDPYTAVTTVLPQEAGGRAPVAAPVRPLRLPPRPAPDTWPATAAAIISAGLAAVLALAGAVAVIVAQGRRRRWRAAAPRS
jgi:membrane-anchored mycosin MYCP